MSDDGHRELARLRRRLGEYERLFEISAELGGSLDLNRVLDVALLRVEEVCRAETSSLWELDDGRGELYFRVVRGRAAGSIRDLRVPLGEGIVGAVAASGRAEIVNDVAADPRWRGNPDGFVTRAILTTPLLAQGRVVGVMQLLNPVDRDGFDAGDLRRVALLAAPLAQAIANARLYSAVRHQFVDTLDALAEATERRDPYTGGHVGRVVAYALLLGSELGLGQGELADLRLAATLHDIGKIATPDAILRKPAPLSPAERLIMRRHADDGARVVSRIRALRHIVPAVRAHHERMDGSGYPDGLAGGDIPQGARIIAVADAFDAMTTSRPYRDGLDPAVAAGRIVAGAGSQFCARVVAAFRTLFERGAWNLEAGRRMADALFSVGELEPVRTAAAPLQRQG